MPTATTLSPSHYLSTHDLMLSTSRFAMLAYSPVGSRQRSATSTLGLQAELQAGEAQAAEARGARGGSPLPRTAFSISDTVMTRGAIGPVSSPSPTPSTSSTTTTNRTRQTRISEHLRAVKSSSSFSLSRSGSPKPKPSPSLAGSTLPVASSSASLPMDGSTNDVGPSRMTTRRSTRSAHTSPEVESDRSEHQRPHRDSMVHPPRGQLQAPPQHQQQQSLSSSSSSSKTSHFDSKHASTSASTTSTTATRSTRGGARPSTELAQMHDYPSLHLMSMPRGEAQGATTANEAFLLAHGGVQAAQPTSTTLGRRSKSTARSTSRTNHSAAAAAAAAAPSLRITISSSSSSSTNGPAIFSTLESPSAPGTRQRKASLTAGSASSPPSASSSTQLSLPPPSTPPSRDGSMSMHLASRKINQPGTPSQQQQTRLLAFSSGRSSVPFAPTLMPPLVGVGIGSSHTAGSSSSSTSDMVAAQVEGMGRVALSRQTLIEQFGVVTAERAIAAAAATSATATPVEELPAFEFGKGVEALAPATDFDAFGTAPGRRRRTSSFVPRRGGGKIGAHKVDERIGRVKHWLDSDDETEGSETIESVAWSKLSRKAAEWDPEHHGVERDVLVAKRLEPNVEVEYVEDSEVDVPADVDERPLVRVGGKNITALLMSKKRRVQEDEDGIDAAADDEASDDAFDEPTKLRSVKGKRRAIEVGCECREIEHADSCPRRTLDASAVFGETPKTPTQSHMEPILVASSHSPRPQSHFLGTGPDMVLAPSPQASPSPRRRAIPRSPASASVPLPVTPQLSQQRADYSPRSPLFYRGPRMRLVSGHLDDPSQAQHAAGGWIGGWDGHNFGYEDPSAYPAISFTSGEEDEWHDMTMTPSRAIGSSSSYSWAETMLSPSAGPGRRSRVPSGIPLIGATTASQDFLSALHHDRMPSNGAYSATAASQVAQRLFGASSPTQQQQHLPAFAGSASAYSSPSHHSALHHLTPSTPLSSLQHHRSTSHRRVPSSTWLHHDSPVAPAPVIHKPLAPPRGLTSTPMQPSLSAPVLPTTPNNSSTGMARSASGLGIGIGGLEFGLDDYMMS